MQVNCSIIYAHVVKSQSEVDGSNVNTVESVKELRAEKELVGMQNYWQGQAQAVVLSQTFIIKKRMLDTKFNVILCGNELYEIFTPSKAKEPEDVKLNCKTLFDENLVQKIREAVK